jgi:transposase
VPAPPPYIFEPIWQQFEALLPEHKTDHPLGCHRSRIPERVVFEKLLSGFGLRLRLREDRRCVLFGEHLA